MMTIQTNRSQLIQLAVFIGLALLSILIAELGVLDAFNEVIIVSLNEKQATVTGLTVAAAATSTALTAIPGDIAMPLAEKFADLTDYLMLALGSLWLQKYLVGLSSWLAFKIFYPLASLLMAGNVFWKREGFKQLVIKLVMLGTMVLTVVPLGVTVSDTIQHTHDVSVQATIKELEETEKKINKDKSLWDKITGAVSSVVEGTKRTFSNMMDAVVVLIITTCVIPVAVFAFFIWMINRILGLNLSMPTVNLMKKTHKSQKDRSSD